MPNDNWAIVECIPGQPESDWRFALWNDGLGGPFATLGSKLAGLTEDSVVMADEGLAALMLCEVETLNDGVVVTGIAPITVATIKPNPPFDQAGFLLDDGTRTPLPADFAKLKAEQQKRWLQSLQGRHQNARLIGRVESPFATMGCWISDGGAAAFHAAWLANEDRARRAENAGLAQGGEHFVNPYNFVPLPAHVERRPPSGHARMLDGNLSGHFDWTLTFSSPLKLPKDHPPTEGLLTYPGSSLRGVLRNLHETMAHGCLSITDLDYVPVHREPMNTYKHTEDFLAIVESLDRQGNARSLRLTEEPFWVPHTVFDDTTRRHLRSGQRVRLETATIAPNTDRASRRELTSGQVIPDVAGEYVIHVSDANAKGKHPTTFYAVGRLSDRKIEVTDVAWARFQRLARGSQDLVNVNGTPPCTAFTGPADVHWPGTPVAHSHTPKGARTKVVTQLGRRRKVDSWLAVGDTVWVRGRGDRLSIKMSPVWRRLGKGSVRDRLPDASHAACRTPDQLCPSCAIFGMVDRERGRDNQAGYASHVRVRSATSTGDVTIDTVDLPPLRSPKPSAGGFYLNSVDEELTKSSHVEGHVPAAHWGGGAKPDAASLRQIRGRKFYWHGQADAPGPGRQRPRAQDATQVDHGVRVVRPGFTLTSRVYFDNVTPAQLASLLAAAAPGRAVNQEGIQVHVGGGKPFGFGSALPSISDLVLDTAQSRYGGGTRLTYDVDRQLRDFAAEAKQGDDRAAVWKALGYLLARDSVRPDRIWYPTRFPFSRLINNWPTNGTDVHTKAVEDFDRSFNWFAKSSGAWEGRLRFLPDPSEPYQSHLGGLK